MADTAPAEPAVSNGISTAPTQGVASSDDMGDPSLNELSRQIVATVQSNASTYLKNSGDLISNTPEPGSDGAVDQSLVHLDGSNFSENASLPASESPASLLDGPSAQYDHSLSPGAPHSPQDIAQCSSLQNKSPPLHVGGGADYIPGTPPQSRAATAKSCDLVSGISGGGGDNSLVDLGSGTYNMNTADMMRPSSGVVPSESLLGDSLVEDLYMQRAASAGGQPRTEEVGDLLGGPPPVQHNGFLVDQLEQSVETTSQGDVVDLLSYQSGRDSSSEIITTTTTTTSKLSSDGVHTTSVVTKTESVKSSEQRGSSEPAAHKPSGIPVNKGSPKKAKPTAPTSTAVPKLDLSFTKNSKTKSPSASPATKRKQPTTKPGASSTARSPRNQSEPRTKPQNLAVATHQQQSPRGSASSRGSSPRGNGASPRGNGSSPRSGGGASPRASSSPRTSNGRGGASPRGPPSHTQGRSRVSRRDTAGDSGIEDDKSQTKRRMPSADKPKPLTGSTATRAVTQRSESAPRTAPAARSNGTNLKTPQHHQNSGGTKMVKPTPKQSLTSPRSHSVGRGTSNGTSNGTGTTTSTPSPRSSTVKSRIVTRTDHVPGGGNVKIETHKMDYGGVKSKCGSKDLMHHTPKGGDKKIETQKLEWSATSKIGSLNNASHKAGGGNKKIETVKTEWKTTSKIGSLKNAKHVPGGGDRKIETHKTEWNAKSKVGSLDNTKHVPKGGDKKIAQHKLDWKVDSKVGSLENATHKPGGGTKKIEQHKLDWNVESRVGSLENATHKPGGGDKKIETRQLDWTVESKVGSLENAKHVPGGGDVKIESHKLDFRENAASRTNMGLGSPASRRKRSSTPSGSQHDGSQHDGSQHEDAPIVGDSNGNVEA